MPAPILVWFRNDLRIHDHEALHAAAQAAQAQGLRLVALYCFDPRHFVTTPYGFAKTGAFRAQFLIDSVADLRRSLQALGSDLIIRHGKLEDIIPELVAQGHCSAVYYHREATAEEIQVEDALAASLNVPIHTFWGHTLYSQADLPFEIADLPDLFTAFRKRVEAVCSVASTFPTPTHLPAVSADCERGGLPTLTELGFDQPQLDNRSVLAFIGGESAGKARLRDYFWAQDRLKTYKETRNGMLGADYSSKFSPWLALGCLSPRYIYSEIKRYEDKRVANDSTYWLVFELLWRDYFYFIAQKHGNAIFKIGGFRGLHIAWKTDAKRFEAWCAGMTGFPLVDANMRELAATGFMSNRGRQNVASFLTKNLGIDWRLGAAYFESVLIDYDAASNWGNWNYAAGVGNDARGFRFFNITKQSKDYDPKGVYIKHWLPELQNLSAAHVHEPWTLGAEGQSRLNVRLGLDYPHPIVDLFASAKHSEKLYDAAS